MSSEAANKRVMDARRAHFITIWQDHQKKLKQFCLRWLSGHHDLADEVMAVTAEKAFVSVVSKGAEIENPFAWLCTISRNISTDIVRNEIKSRGLVEQVDMRPEQYYFADNHSDTLEKTIENEMELDAIWQEMEKLPKDYKHLLVMRVVDGMAYQEISERTNLSPVNIRKRIQLARSELRLIAAQ